MAPTQCVECVASLTNLLLMSYLDARNWRSLNTLKSNEVCQNYNIMKSAYKWYEHKPEAVVENKQPETRYHN